MSNITPEQAWEVFRRADRLYSEDQVMSSIKKMADAISTDLSQMNPIVVCVMNGALIPLGMLLTHLQFPLQVDYVHATRYGEKLVGADLRWLSGPHMDCAGRVVLLVDDILDEGATLAGIEQYYIEHGASRVYKAALVVKDRKRTVDVRVEYTGLAVPDRYVFGYGMDYKGYLRNVPGIYAEVES